MKVIKLFLLTYLFFNTSSALANSNDFNLWLNKFKSFALSQGISHETINLSLNNAKFLPKVIEYDRYQPEFYEDTYTYINKRTSKNKIKQGLKLYNENNCFPVNFEEGLKIADFIKIKKSKQYRV